MNFWNKLPKPFFVLAPMADVTDEAFRLMFAKYGKPDVTWTEFVSADGLASKEGRKGLRYDLLYSEKERPIIVQLFSSNVEKMREATKYVVSLGFDGIDINMGCPDKKVEKQGAGAALMKDMEKAGKIIQAVRDGIEDARKSKTKNSKIRKYISVSVKTRIGYNKNQIDEWIPFLLSQNIDVLTVHARTRKEMSKVPANWEHIKEVVNIRNKMKVKTKIIGNGDVKNIKEGRKLAKETKCDGIMIGRGVFGNPWIFSCDKKTLNIEENLNVLIEHTKLFEKLFRAVKNFSIMKKHYKAYVNGFDGAKDLRTELMETKNSKEVEKIIKEFVKKQHKKED